MNRLAFLIAKHNADVRCSPMASDVCLTRDVTGGIRLTYCSSLSSSRALIGVTMMLGILELGWEGRQFRFRFQQLDDPIPLRRKHVKARRDYRLPYRWASRYLVPDRLLEQAAREELEAWQLAEQEGLSEDLIAARAGEWMSRGQMILPFFWPAI